MVVEQTGLPGLLLLKPRVYQDERGSFRELWRADRYAAAGIRAEFVQDNVSTSTRGVLRGLHYQWPHPQAKLVTALHGEVWDVAVDLRVGSPTYGRHFGCTLSGENGWQLYLPEGFAHGLLVTSEEAVFAYKCTALYHPECEVTVAWDDPELGVPWPGAAPILSEKDRAGVRLRDLPAVRLPRLAPAP